jgi:hypothetical protein
MRNTDRSHSTRSGSKLVRSKEQKRKTKRRSGKKNNYRKPLQKKKGPAPVSEDSTTEEVPESSDENAPNLPNVRVIRRRVINYEEDLEGEGEQQRKEAEVGEETEDLLD